MTVMEIRNMVRISDGNIKVGDIPNMSLAPGRSCSACACKTCLQEGCYALKAYRQYGNVRAAWDFNTDQALHNLADMERGLNAYFDRRPDLEFFRVHVGGDFITAEYAAMWARIAAAHPKTKFLSFTKQFDNVRVVAFPDNFSLVLSGWKGCEIPADLASVYPSAIVIEKDEPVPANALFCPGKCETCGMCWDLKKAGMNVAFRKH